MPNDEQLDMGVMAEGVIELDPMSGRLVLRYEDRQGNFQFLDIEERLRHYQGEEVRCIITPMRTVARLAELVQAGQVPLDGVPTVPKLG